MCFELHGGTKSVRLFFHVEYKLDANDRKIKDDELPALERQLLSVQQKISEISDEIEHSRKQEATLKEVGGK